MAVSPVDLIKYFEDYICPVCKGRATPGGFTTWFRVQPASAQALHGLGAGEKANYEQKIKNEIAKHSHQMKWDLSGATY